MFTLTSLIWNFSNNQRNFSNNRRKMNLEMFIKNANTCNKNLQSIKTPFHQSSSVILFNLLKKRMTPEKNLKKTPHYILVVTVSLCFLAPKIWKLVPESITNEKSLIRCKRKIKFWTTDKCASRNLWKIYKRNKQTNKQKSFELFQHTGDTTILFELFSKVSW